MSQKVLQFLDLHTINYILHSHLAVFTCEEATELCKNIPWVWAKNIFLTDKNKKNFILVVLPEYKKLDIKKLETLLNVKKLRFASEEILLEKLWLTPWSVSPFWLINDTKNEVLLCLDIDIVSSSIVSFHPNINTQTLELTQENFMLYLKTLKKEFFEVHFI